MDSVTIELYPDQVAFLRRMVETHHLFDVSKAVRVLITYARQDGYAAGIYGKIRCTMC
ncbi:MAG: hypothetical protein HY423_00215 [Candidatus Lambdaproteobacteria bacterium]|nr:hypothetical protein [Candidatus Lambdaproteobacteria bacterium]